MKDGNISSMNNSIHYTGT